MFYADGETEWLKKSSTRFTGDKKHMTTDQIAKELQSKRNEVVADVLSGSEKRFALTFDPKDVSSKGKYTEDTDAEVVLTDLEKVDISNNQQDVRYALDKAGENGYNGIGGSKNGKTATEESPRTASPGQPIISENGYNSGRGGISFFNDVQGIRRISEISRREETV